MEDTLAQITALAPEKRFVDAVIAQFRQNKELAARLRHAGNPATEYLSWEFLADYGINLEHESQRLPYTTIAVAIARANAEANGELYLGKAIAACYKGGSRSDQAKARLRRLLACNDLPELCRILRPVLMLIESRVGQPLDYQHLLKQLRSFTFNMQRIKAQWAQEFYNQSTPHSGEEAA